MTHHAEAKVVVVGSTMIDLIAYTGRLPDSGETVVGHGFEMGFGGKGANQAVMARLLGASVAMVNCLGTDFYGDMTMENFAGFGIDTSHVIRSESPSGVASIWVEENGANQIIIVPGANHAMTTGPTREAVRASQPDVVVGQLEIPQEVTLAGFTAAHEVGAVTVLNPAPAAELLEALLAETDWLVPNEVEFEQLTGRPAHDDQAMVGFSSSLPGRLLLTLGADGVALVTESGEVVRIPSIEVEAVDTTGAGDAFVGAFAFGLAAGLGELDAARLGNACAAQSVTRTGTQSSFPDRAGAQSILASLEKGT